MALNPKGQLHIYIYIYIYIYIFPDLFCMGI